MSAAKNLFPESHPQFAGIYWGKLAVPRLGRSLIELCIGTISNDYSTVGWTAKPSGANVVTADVNRVTLTAAISDLFV